MKAYLVLDLRVNDLAGFRRYVAEIPAHIEDWNAIGRALFDAWLAAAAGVRSPA